MGNLTYMLNVSLDGFVETPDRSLAWGRIDDELHRWFNDQARGIQASLYGRRLYELMAAHWPTAEQDPATTEVERDFARIWNATPKVVFSTTLDRVRPNDRLVAGDVGPILDDVRSQYPGDLEVGGPTLAAQFVERQLVDVYHLVIHPVVLGAGTPYWPALERSMDLRLTETHTFGSGVVALRYERG
jgi:dihydrofolate reductase